jgi:hypothetical protein
MSWGFCLPGPKIFYGGPPTHPLPTEGEGSCLFSYGLRGLGRVFKLSADAQGVVSPLAQAPTGSEVPPAGIFAAR